METRSRASPKQFLILLDFMEKYGDLSKPEPGPQGRLKVDRLWIKLTQMLNSIDEGVKKSPVKWRKVWADWKTKTKKKYIYKKNNDSDIVDGPKSKIIFNTLEKRLLEVIRAPTLYGQRSSISEHDGRSINVDYDDEMFDEDVESIAESPPESDSPPPALPPPSPSPSPPRTSPIRRRLGSTRPLKARRFKTPFQRAIDEFASVERCRIQFEEARDKRYHELELERLRVDGERTMVAREHNILLQRFSGIAERLLGVISTMKGSGNLPSPNAAQEPSVTVKVEQSPTGPSLTLEPLVTVKVEQASSDF